MVIPQNMVEGFDPYGYVLTFTDSMAIFVKTLVP